jgi:acyl-CoA thioesterase
MLDSTPTPMKTHALHRFDRDIALAVAEKNGDDEVRIFDAQIDEGWWITTGPNGGYLNAMLLRGMIDTVSDETREPRTQTTHFTARARPGPAHVTTQILRSGRSLSTVSARLEQNGRLIAYPVGALATARRSPDGGEHQFTFQDATMPEVPPPDRVEVAPTHSGSGAAIPFGERYEKRPVFGATEPSLREPATTGGWIRPQPERVGDALLISALSDAWPPAIFHKQPPGEASRGVPTVELTVHFRAPTATSEIAPGAYYLVHFGTRMSRDGFLEETGEIWSPDGVLLAESRQLALMA